MSDRFFHGYWRLKHKVSDLEHELELRVEYAQDLEAQIIELKKTRDELLNIVGNLSPKMEVY